MKKMQASNDRVTWVDLPDTFRPGAHRYYRSVEVDDERKQRAEAEYLVNQGQVGPRPARGNEQLAAATSDANDKPGERTPGEWTDGNGGLSRLASSTTEKEYGVWAGGVEIAIVHQKADATFIAAAPETKRERDEAISLLREFVGNGCYCGEHVSECRPCRTVRAFLARIDERKP